MAEKHVPSWDEVREQLGASWNSTMEGERNPWDQVEEAAHFGYEQGLRLGRLGADWDDVKDDIQAEWEQNVPHPRWESWYEAEDAAHLGFHRAIEELSRTRAA
jgi:hypothetical protein